jgi:hypothetical protein
VRAATDGGVTISQAVARRSWISIAFSDRVHDQTWRGFRFANAGATQTGVIVFGNSGDIVPVPPHHITLLNMTIDKSITSDNPGSGDHAMYFCKAQSPGVHDILIDGYTVDGSGGVNTAVTFFASAAGQPNANNVTIRHMTVTGTRQAVEFWDPTLQNIVIEDSTVSGARLSAVRYELGGTVTLRRVTSTGSGQSGFSRRSGRPAGSDVRAAAFTDRTVQRSLLNASCTASTDWMSPALGTNTATGYRRTFAAICLWKTSARNGARCHRCERAVPGGRDQVGHVGRAIPPGRRPSQVARQGGRVRTSVD